MKERIGYYDIVRGLGIIFVVIGHIDTFCMPFRNVVISFHMALFLMVSGMLFLETGEENKQYLTVIGKRFRRIMLPYICFSLISVAIEFVRLALQGIYHWPHFRSLLNSIWTLQGNSVMWFLPALFISESVFLAVRKTKSDLFTIFSVMGLAVLAIWCNTLKLPWKGAGADLCTSLMRGVFCTLFICIGYYIRKYIVPLKIPAYIGWIVAVIFLAVSVKMNQINPKVDLRALKWGEAWFSTQSKFVLHAYLASLYLIGAIAGATAILLICRSLEKFSRTPILKVIAFFGSNSLIIMATHLDWHVLHYSIDFAAWINRIWPSSFFYHLLVLIFVFAIETILIMGINKYMPFLAGKRKLKNIS